MKKHFIGLVLLFFAPISVGLFCVAKFMNNTPSSCVSMPIGQDIIPVVVVGSGPAGLTAALYGGRSGTRTVVVKGLKPGGALTETSYVENWPGEEKILGQDLINKLEKHATAWGAEFVEDSVESINFSDQPFEITLQSGKKLYAYAIIIATGSSPRLLNISGEKEYWGKGVTTCAICDAPFYKDKEVVVVGGGDSAAEEALQLKAYAKKIYVLVRKSKMRAVDYLQKRLQAAPNIEIVYNTQVVEILGNGNHVNQVKLKDSKTGTLRIMPIDGVFLAIGHIPNTEMFNKQLQLTADGKLAMKGRTQQTSVAGVFAAGDVVQDANMQAISAAGEGSSAMLQALEWLNTQNISLSSIERPIQSQESSMASISKDVPISSTPTMNTLASLNDFDQAIKNQQLVLVDFYADYCASCKRMMPHLQDAAQEFSGKADFYKVDVGQTQNIATHYKVSSLPTVLVFQNGNEVKRLNKALSRKEIDQVVNESLI